MKYNRMDRKHLLRELKLRDELINELMLEADNHTEEVVRLEELAESNTPYTYAFFKALREWSTAFGVVCAIGFVLVAAI